MKRKRKFLGKLTPDAQERWTMALRSLDSSRQVTQDWFDPQVRLALGLEVPL
jgi:hypothetical protein